MISSLSPRHNQIDLLTRGLELPFEALHEEHLSVVADVIVIAWTDLLRSESKTLLSGTEAEINALMETRLGQLLDEHPLWEQMVRCVTRGKETLSFDGAHLEKRPDLSIHLTARSQAFPLIVECKLIDVPGRKGADLYCSNGVGRFINGDYGWATQEAFMLAYVRDGSSVACALIPIMEASRSRAPEPYAIEEMPQAVMFSSVDLARSRHGRPFRYPRRLPPHDTPGTITLWHLWLGCTRPGAAPELGGS